MSHVADWYESLVEDCDCLVTEGIFNHHLTLIVTYHHVGRRIALDKESIKESGWSMNEVVQHVAKDINRSPRMVRYAIKLFDRFPDLSLLPEGKNVTMRKVINEYLTDGEKKDQSPSKILHEFSKLDGDFEGYDLDIRLNKDKEEWTCILNSRVGKGFVSAVGKNMYGAVKNCYLEYEQKK